ncbi:MAG: leucine-rich repeat protein [Peptostreptococcus sp.]|uniref:leucine-rich repeat protein n=1 Tax=Peptostreptococcus sp. TaxID=1262 RepID=UPI002FC8ACE6
MFKKISAITLSLLLSVSAMPSMSFAQENDLSKEILQSNPVINNEYEFDEKNNTITNYNGNSKEIVIPEKINGISVKKIGPKAFASKNLEKISFSEGLESIEKQAFMGNTTLKEVDFSSTIKIIGEASFSKCGIENLIIPEGIEVIDNIAFFANKNLQTVQLPDSLKVINKLAFSQCTSLSGEIYLGKNLSTFETNAFQKIDNKIDLKVAEEGSSLFFVENSIPNNYITLKLPKYRNITVLPNSFQKGADMLIDLGSLEIKQNTSKNDVKNELSKIALKSGFRSVNKNTSNADKVYESELEWNIDDLDTSTISTTNIKGFFTPINNSLINKNDLMDNDINNDLLKKIDVNLDVKIVKDSSNVESEKWNQNDFIYGNCPSTILQGGEYFAITGLSDSGKTKIKTNKNLVLPNSIEVLENGKKVTKKIRGIGQNSFDGLGINNLELPKINDGYNNFIIDINSFANNNITDIDIPNGVKSIDSYAFKNNNIKELYIPSSVVKIGNESFCNNKIDNLEFSDDVKLIQIDNFSFKNNNLKSVHLPYSIFKIKEYVFANNPGMEKIVNTEDNTQDKNYGVVHLYTRNPSHLTNDTYIYGSKYQKFILKGKNVVRKDLYEKIELANSLQSDDYKKVSWNNFIEILKQAKITFKNEDAQQEDINDELSKLSESMNNLESIDINKKILISKILELEKLKEELYTKESWSNLIDQINNSKTIVDKANVTQDDIDKSLEKLTDLCKNLEIAEHMKWTTSDFSYEGSTITGYSESGKNKFKVNKELIIPNTTPSGEKVTAIGNKAFEVTDGIILSTDTIESPEGLTSVIIPETVTSIGDLAFKYNSLRNINFPKDLNHIGTLAFNGNQLQEILIPDSVNSMGTGVFSLNPTKKAKLSKSMDKVPDGIFSRNIQLTNIEIPEGVKVIGQSAFVGAPLTEINIPSTVTDIERKAFSAQRCEKIRIPGNVKNIAEFGFEENKKFRHTKEIILGEGVESIKANAFKGCLLKEVTLPNSLKFLDDKAFNDNLNDDKKEAVVKLYTNNPKHMEIFNSSKYHTIELRKDTSSGSSSNISKHEKYTRIFGENRIATSANISKKYFNKSDHAVIVSSTAFTDALTSSMIANKLNAPILLSNRNNIDKSVIKEIERLGASNVTIVGGENTLSNSIKKDLENINVKIDRIAGNNRYETSTELAKQLLGEEKICDDVFLIDGTNISDGLSVANLSTKLNKPVLLTRPNMLPSETKAFLKDYKIKNIHIIGGDKSINKNVESSLRNYKIDRIAGNNRYETSTLIAKKAYPNAKSIHIANGKTGVDALVSGSIISKTNTPLVLVEESNNFEVNNWYKENNMESINVIGGEISIPNKIIFSITAK